MRHACLTLVLLALGAGYAAATGKSSTTAGTARGSSCGAFVELGYEVAYDATLHRYGIRGVRVDGLGGCGRANVRIELTGRSGRILHALVHRIGSAEARAGRATLALDGHVAAAAVRGVRVAIAR